MSHSIDFFLRENRRTTDTVLMILSFVSAFFTYQGAVLVLDQAEGTFNPMAFVFSGGVSAGLFLFWRYALAIVPTMNTTRTRVYGMAIIGLGCIFIVCLSSWMNVMALAGAGALEAHMRGSMKDYETALQSAYTQAKGIESLTADIDLAAQRYGNLANREIRQGALTGVAGAGGVADSLRATQGGFVDLAALIRSRSAELDNAYVQGRASLNTMESLVSGENAVAERHARFSEEAAKVANVIGQMKNSDLTALVARTVTGFSGSTGLFSLSLKNGALATAQNNALQRIASDLENTGGRIAIAATAIGEAERTTTPAFNRIGISTAVILYADELLPYWAGGIGLDLMPVVLILLVMLLYYAANALPQTDPDIDNLPFGTVRKVFLAMEQAKPGLRTGNKDHAPALTDQTQPPKRSATNQNRLNDLDEDEWTRHLNGGN